MGSAVYNLGIFPSVTRQLFNLRSADPNVSNRAAVARGGISATSAIYLALNIFLIAGFPIAAQAADWYAPEQQLARKIVDVTGPGSVAWTVENRSSLGRRETDVITNGLRASLEAAGIRFVTPEQAVARVAIVLSENSTDYVWVAEIHQGVDAAVVMVSTPRRAGPVASRDSVPMTLQKILLWSQEERILDVAVLDEGVTQTHIAVLDPEKVSLHRLRDGKWQQEQVLTLSHARPWPRDMRGRLLPAKDHLLDAYLPGVLCRSTGGIPLSMSCHESDDPWPLVAGAAAHGTNLPMQDTASGFPLQVAPISAFFAPTRNFFTGALSPGVGKYTTISKFYSAAFLPRDKYVLWLFSSVDGQMHLVDGVSDVTARLGWGSDLTSVRTACGAGWQVLATDAGNKAGDSVRAYEFPDRNAVPVSPAVEFSGDVTALWAEAKGDTAIAVIRNRETGNYEAFRLAVACNQ
jgi:hypothetical protein